MKQYVARCIRNLYSDPEIYIKEFTNKIDFPVYSIFMGVEDEPSGISLSKDSFSIIEAENKDDALEKLNAELDDCVSEYRSIFEKRFNIIKDKYVVGMSNDVNGKIDFLIEADNELSTESVKTTFNTKKDKIKQIMVYRDIIFDRITVIIQNKIGQLKEKYNLDFICNRISDFKVFFLRLPEGSKENLCEIKFYNGILKRANENIFNESFGFGNKFNQSYKFQYNLDSNEKYYDIFDFNISSLELADIKYERKVIAIYHDRSESYLTFISTQKNENILGVYSTIPDFRYMQQILDNNSFIELRLNDNFIYIDREYFIKNVNINRYDNSIEIMPDDHNFDNAECIFFSYGNITKIFNNQLTKQLSEEDYNLWKLRQEVERGVGNE